MNGKNRARHSVRAVVACNLPRRARSDARRVSPALPKRQRAGALQDASRGSGACGQRASVLECGGPPPLFSAPTKLFAFFKHIIVNSSSAEVRLFCGTLRVPPVPPKRQRAGALQDLADQWRGLPMDCC